MSRNIGSETGAKGARDTKGRFGPGNPGKPLGVRNKATQAALTLLEGEAEALVRKAVEMALGGDLVALRLCLERLAPVRRNSAIQFDLPDLSTSKSAPAGLSLSFLPPPEKTCFPARSWLRSLFSPSERGAKRKKRTTQATVRHVNCKQHTWQPTIDR